ncbi:MAG: c-type cytochrome [Dehalococcoidales bacterium]|nr:c-type cytochrome [Dehalococcoidales bacterium]
MKVPGVNKDSGEKTSRMKMKSAWLGGALVLGLSVLSISCGMIEPPPPSPPTAKVVVPLIPHSIEGRDDCRVCHERGIGGAPQFPVVTHSERPSDVCLACHEPASAGTETADRLKVPLEKRTAFPYFDNEEGNTSATTPKQPEETISTTPQTPSEASPEIPAAVSAKELYDSRCAACHGANREGIPGFAPALTPESLAALGDTEIRDVIADGRTGTGMPPFKATLSLEEIDALLHLIKSPAP